MKKFTKEEIRQLESKLKQEGRLTWIKPKRTLNIFLYENYIDQVYDLKKTSRKQVISTFLGYQKTAQSNFLGNRDPHKPCNYTVLPKQKCLDFSKQEVQDAYERVLGDLVKQGVNLNRSKKDVK